MATKKPPAKRRTVARTPAEVQKCREQVADQAVEEVLREEARSRRPKRR